IDRRADVFRNQTFAWGDGERARPTQGTCLQRYTTAHTAHSHTIESHAVAGRQGRTAFMVVVIVATPTLCADYPPPLPPSARVAKRRGPTARQRQDDHNFIVSRNVHCGPGSNSYCRDGH